MLEKKNIFHEEKMNINNNISRNLNEFSKSIDYVSNWAITFKKTQLNSNNSNKNFLFENILLNIFMNYSDFSEIDFQYYLSLTNLNKILKNIGIIEKKKSQITISDINIIFKKVKGNLLSNKLNFREFESLIFQLAMLINEDKFKKDIKNYMNFFITKYFKKISDKCSKSNNIINNINSIEFNSTSNIIKILSKIIKKLKEIYFQFFKYDIDHNINNEKTIKENLKSCFIFLKSYEICPLYISIKEISLYYYLIINIQEEEIPLFSNFKLGNNFNFQKFCHFLTIIGISIINKEKNEFNDKSQKIMNKKEDKNYINHYINLNNEEKFIQFLNKLNNLEGIEKTHKNFSHITMNSNNSNILPDKKYIDDFFPNAFYYKEKSKGNLFYLSKNFNENNLINHLNEKNELNQILFFKNQNIINKKILKEIFEYYSDYNDKYQMNKIGYNDFMKFIKDFNLFNLSKLNTEEKNNIFSSSLRMSKLQTTSTIKQNIKLNKSEISKRNILNEQYLNILWSDISGKKNQKIINLNSIKPKINLNRSSSLNSLKPNSLNYNKLNYFQFIEILLSISQILYFDSFDIFVKFLEEGNNIYLNIQEKKNEIMNKFYIIQNNNQLIKILNSIKKILKNYYNYYSKNKEKITFDIIIKIYKDFNILPYFISFIELKNIFFTLADILNNKQDLEKEKKINFELFLISLGIISLSINTSSNLTNIERLILLLVQIAYSEKKNQFFSNETFSIRKDLFNIIIELEKNYPSIFEKSIPFYEEIIRNPEKLSEL